MLSALYHFSIAHCHLPPSQSSTNHPFANPESRETMQSWMNSGFTWAHFPLSLVTQWIFVWLYQPTPPLLSLILPVGIITQSKKKKKNAVYQKTLFYVSMWLLALYSAHHFFFSSAKTIQWIRSWSKHWFHRESVFSYYLWWRHPSIATQTSNSGIAKFVRSLSLPYVLKLFSIPRCRAFVCISLT